MNPDGISFWPDFDPAAADVAYAGTEITIREKSGYVYYGTLQMDSTTGGFYVQLEFDIEATS